VHRYGRRLAAGVHRVLRRNGARLSAEDREDVLQEVYCRLLERRGARLARCADMGHEIVGAYLGRVAERVAIDHLRAASAAKRGAGSLVDGVSGRSGMDLVCGAPDGRRSPEQRLIARELRREFLMRCGRAVAPRTRRRSLRVVYLAFFEGWSSREIAAELGGGLTQSSIDSLLHRLKGRLAEAGLRLPRR